MAVRHVLAIAVVLAVAGCADDDPAPAPKSEPTASTSPASTVTRSSSTGTVKSWDSTKRTGLITPDSGSGDLPVHYSEIKMDGFKLLGDGQRVSFVAVRGRDGLVATNVQVIDGY